MTLLLASCNEDYKDWNEPQSNSQDPEIVFGAAHATGVDLINFAEMPASVDMVQVCQMVVPSSSDETYEADCYIVLGDEEFPITNEGYMDADTLSEFAVKHFGRDSVVNDIPAHVLWVMTNGKTATTFASEPFVVSVIPAPLAIPDLWYLTGSCVGDGRGLVNSSEETVGISLIPMYATPGKLSKLTYIGYLGRGKFYIVHRPGDWSEKWGTNADGGIEFNGGTPISVGEAGYYKIDLDVDHNTLDINMYDGEIPETNSSMNMPGDYQGWQVGENPMTAMSSRYLAQNHDWVVKNLTFTQAALLKFAANGSWDVNWGNEAFPVGAGVQDGKDIPVAAGTYTVFFNDILGYYYFMEQGVNAE